MSLIPLILVNTLFFITYIIPTHSHGPKPQPITYGSVLKLLHIPTQHHLTSHPIRWGTGSGQQSVTASKDSPRTAWQIFSSPKFSQPQGDPIKCNSRVFLKNTASGCYLHSHRGIQSPLNHQQEVSCHPSEEDGNSEWLVFCITDSSNNGVWNTDTKVKLQHVSTDRFLSANDKHVFGASHCGQECPIIQHVFRH